jgi:protein-S-isoprenylcysteine O-methyltransferase Ste14
MDKVSASVGSLIFFAIAPGSIAGLLPWWITRWQFRPAFLDIEGTRLLGALLIAAGLLPLIDSFARFALQGLGTPAPIAPPQRLVVTGYYRHVRNPMYVGVVCAILGQALLFADARLVWCATWVWFAFHLFVVVYEEPTLQRSFPIDYENFCANVPRWLPRPTPWESA